MLKKIEDNPYGLKICPKKNNMTQVYLKMLALGFEQPFNKSNINIHN